jgi:hypothetical protein
MSLSTTSSRLEVGCGMQLCRDALAADSSESDMAFNNKDIIPTRKH